MQHYADLVNQIATAFLMTYTSYETQHQEFCKHVEQQIAMLSQQGTVTHKSYRNSLLIHLFSQTIIFNTQLLFYALF